MLLPALLVILVVVIAVHATVRWSVERAVAARLPVGADGLIAGAQPIDLRDPAAARAVLLLHGFGDTPQTLVHLASALHARGFAVLAPLLPGHGRTLRAFRAATAEQWMAEAAGALAMLRAQYAAVGIAGLSMGGALAVELAARGDEIDSVGLLAPYLDPPRSVRWAARCAPVLRWIMPYVFGRNTRSIHDPEARRATLDYQATPPALLAQLVRLADHARGLLPAVRAPTLMIQSREDNRIAPGSAARVFAAIGAADKRLVWREGAGHVITVDFGWSDVARLVSDWMDVHVGRAESRSARNA